MMSMFSSFDKSFFSYSIVALFMLTISLLLSTRRASPLMLSLVFIRSSLKEFFFSLKPMGFSKSMQNLIYSFMVVTFFLNFLSVFSYSYPMNSRFSMVLFFSLSLWLSLIAFSIKCNFKGLLMHYIPEGTPMPLTPFLWLVELISAIIRPITLTVRLVANILAGHLLMVLLSQLVLMYPLSFPFYMGLNLVELAVALVQSYIFATMFCLYFSEL